jgi:hypothetical protein
MRCISSFATVSYTDASVLASAFFPVQVTAE